MVTNDQSRRIKNSPVQILQTKIKMYDRRNITITLSISAFRIGQNLLYIYDINVLITRIFQNNSCGNTVILNNKRNNFDRLGNRTNI